MNVDLKIVVTDLWQSFKLTSLMTVFWKQCGLRLSITSNRVPFLFLERLFSLPKLANAKISLRSKKYSLASLIRSKRLIFNSPVTIMFTNLQQDLDLDCLISAQRKTLIQNLEAYRQTIYTTSFWIL